jgi:hypothetical protein
MPLFTPSPFTGGPLEDAIGQWWKALVGATGFGKGLGRESRYPTELRMSAS